MQLNNKNTHEIMLINRIDFDTNSVILSKYHRPNGTLSENIRVYIDVNSLDLKSKLQETVNMYDTIYNHLVTLQEFIDYEASTDLLNWKVSDRNIRLIIPQSLVNQAMLEQNDLNTIIQRELASNAQATNKFVFQTEQEAVAYFHQVDSADAPIIQPYIDSGEIILETK